ncbi:MAG: hypothetical protein PHS97_07805 [Oscillospiraceae bacterium]|nr:hypothetical protein [Oscillospiraceae bacterium]
MNKHFDSLLQPGEKILWVGKPEKSKLLQGVGATGIVKRWIICGSIALALTLLYVTLCYVKRDSTTFSWMVLVFTLVIPMLAAWSPVTDLSRINMFLEYAITNERVLVRTNDDAYLIMPRKQIDSVKVREVAEGTAMIYLGSPIFSLPDKILRYTAVHGMTEEKDTKKIVRGLVLYNLRDAAIISALFTEQNTIVSAVSA